MAPHLEGFTPYKKEDADKYKRLRWWPGLTFGDILDKAADIYPDKEALVDRETRFTYSQVQEKTNKLALGFIDLGINRLTGFWFSCPIGLNLFLPSLRYRRSAPFPFC